MADASVNRRAALRMLGAGVATAVAAPVIGGGTEAAGDGSLQPESSVADGRRLIEPLVTGSTLSHWRVQSVRGLEAGAVSVVLVDRHEQPFQLDICARDDALGALRGPARTERFEIFLANEGDGATGTHEDHGLAAMALAEIVRGNEAHVSVAEFETLARRLSRRSVRRLV